MSRRNPPSARLRRSGWPGEAASYARLLRALVRRRGFPRGWTGGRRAAARRGAWFLGVDPRLATRAWLAAVAALPLPPASGPGSEAGRAWLARLEALGPLAARERAEIEAWRRGG